MHIDRVWYKAKLLPAAASIFTEAFYPEPSSRAGNQFVFFAEVQAAPSHSKILLASRMASNSFRMLTLELARHCIEPGAKATKAQSAELNSLSLHLDKNL